jgi:ATP-binding cassette subfamily B protein
MLKQLDIVVYYGLLMVGISLLGFFSNIINIRISAYAAIGFGTRLRSALFQKIQEFSFKEIDKFKSESLITRLTNDITKIQYVILMALRILLRSPLMMILALFFVIRSDAGLSLIVISSIVMLSVSIIIILKLALPNFTIVQNMVDKLNGVVRENLINIRVVKSFVREDFEIIKFKKANNDLRDISIKAANTIVSVFPTLQLIMNISVAIILYAGGTKVISGELSVGVLISLVNYMVQILMSLLMLAMIFINIANATASSKRVMEVLETESSLKDTPETVAHDYKINEGSIEFRDVSFSYSEGNGILKDINFTVKKGETIAIVGGTGSGKSSLIQLMARLYDATKGEVLIDNRNIRDYTLREVHEKVGVVLQNSELFSGTIRENIRWGDKDATDNEITEITKIAEAYDFIQSFPEKFDSFIERSGVNISGGQKQRISIARALLRKPRILILDDCMSAIDANTEQQIRNNLKSILSSTTVFIVTQRVKTMQHADKVLLLEDGKITTFDTPENLKNNSNLFQDILLSQNINNETTGHR